MLLGENLFITAEGDNKVLGVVLLVLVRTFGRAEGGADRYMAKHAPGASPRPGEPGVKSAFLENVIP